jgi:translation initiation factor IF-1
MKHLQLVRLMALSVPFISALPVVHAAPVGRDGNYREAIRSNTVRGIVSRVYDSREFDVRADGDIVRVKSDAYANLRPGDYVVVRGELRGGTFYAERVNRQDDNVRGNQGREGFINFRGEVVEVESRNSLRVRADNGRVYSVRINGILNNRISRGDLVSVQGRFDGSFVRASNNDVDLLRNDNTYNGNNRVVSGVVNSVRGNREFDLRVNNQIVRVQSDSYLNLRRGDLVSVRGVTRGGTLFAEQVTRRDDNIYDNGGRTDRVNFRGEVIEVESRNSLRVRGDNGRVYTVRTIGDLNNRISRGDRISVQGTFDGSFVRADNDSVDLLRNDNVYNGR